MPRNFIFFLLTITSIIISRYSRAQIIINEVMSSNFSAYQDEDGKYDDWIEFYNTGSDSVNLSGYGLSDNTLEKFRFTFPAMVLAPQEHLIVFAGDDNRTLPGAHWESAVRADH